MPNGHVLVVDDDEAVGRVLAALLHQAGLGATWVADAAQALAFVDKKNADAVIADVRMPGMDGIELLGELRRRWQDLPVLMLTAHGTIPLAVEAMKRGAADFLLKPFDRDEILLAVNKALARPAAPPVDVSSSGVGESEIMAELWARVARVAATESTVLVRGETGTGKALVAQAIHERSRRAKGAFITVQCAGFPESLLESELFGYEKGAFTGAASRKPGRVELAQGGTLFLDEIGELSPAVQVKLLRLLQERTFERLGGTQPLTADVRFIAATHRSLEQMVEKREFREDLFYRLNVIPIDVPPLRARKGDIALLARHFCAQASQQIGAVVKLSDEAVQSLEAQPWPGNVRQLQNVMLRLAVLSVSDTLSVTDVQRELDGGAQAPAEEGLRSKVREAEVESLKQALAKTHGNRTLAARLLGISRRTLYNKLDEYGLA